MGRSTTYGASGWSSAVPQQVGELDDLQGESSTSDWRICSLARDV
jgi:hypothetical protein